MEQKDNIELRSEKVRNIIGQIPPRIIRLGIAVFAIIIALTTTIACFYTFPSVINAESLIHQHNDCLHYTILVPVEQSAKIKAEQKVLFKNDKISSTNPVLFESMIQQIDSNNYVSSKGIYLRATGTFKHDDVVIADTIEFETEIYVGKNNVIQWILNK